MQGRILSFLAFVAAGLVGCSPDQPPSGPEATVSSAPVTVALEPSDRRHVMLELNNLLDLAFRRELAAMEVELLERRGRGFYVSSVPVRLAPENENDGRIAVDGLQPMTWQAIDSSTKRSDFMLRPFSFNGEWSWAITDAGKVLTLVQFYEDVEDGRITAIFDTLGIGARRYGANSWQTELTEDQIEAMVELDEVARLEAGPSPPELMNNESRRVLETDGLQMWTNFPTKPPEFSLNGKGVFVGISDDGIDQAHEDLKEFELGGEPRFYNELTASGEHGTHVASIAVGSGFSSENLALRGHATGARIGEYRYLKAKSEEHCAAINQHGTDVINHSYGISKYSNYSIEYADLDSLIRGDDVTSSCDPINPIPQVLSVGNDNGYFETRAPTKNGIVVGGVATENCDPPFANCTMMLESSRGPTQDYRIKPDVVAPGCHTPSGSKGIKAAQSTEFTVRYKSDCGTSMAAPAVTGLLALMMEKASIEKIEIGMPSTYRALLIHSATDLVSSDPGATAVPTYPGPDLPSGWGLVNADAAVTLTSASLQWKDTDAVGPAETGVAERTYCLNVADDKPVKVTLAWDDPAGSTCVDTGTGTCPENMSRLEHDLDLVVEGPDGLLHHPWKLDEAGDWSNPQQVQASKGEDHRNNVEVVSVEGEPIQSTQWRVRVSAEELAEDQGYSLIASHRILATCPPAVCDEDSTASALCPTTPSSLAGDVQQPAGDLGNSLSELNQIDAICEDGAACACENEAWEVCPNFQLEVDGVPEDAVVIVLDDVGNEIGRDESTAPSRKITVDSPRLPADRVFLIAADRSGRKYLRPLPLKVGFRAL
ncbi:MAG: S8 family serine peptidase [Pseudomonadota bacterium]